MVVIQCTFPSNSCLEGDCVVGAVLCCLRIAGILTRSCYYKVYIAINSIQFCIVNYISNVSFSLKDQLAVLDPTTRSQWILQRVFHQIAAWLSFNTKSKAAQQNTENLSINQCY